MRSNQRTLVSLALGLTALLALATGAPAQQAAAPGMGAAGAETKIALDLRDIPFRTAVLGLFGPTGLQYAIDPTTPNYPITVSLRDVDFPTALRVILRQGQATYRKEAAIFLIGPKMAQTEQTAAMLEATPEAQPATTAAEQTWEKIPIQFQNATLLGLAFGAIKLPTEDQLVGGMGGGMGAGMGGMGGMGGGMSGMGGMGGGMGAGGMGGGGYGGGGRGRF